MDALALNSIGTAGNLTLWYAAMEPALRSSECRPRPWFTLCTDEKGLYDRCDLQKHA